MLNSGDSYLISIFIILIPSIALLIGTVIFSYIVIKRYSKIISRLYKMNFKSLETERKRIANDLHDQIGYKMTIINKSIDTMAQKLHIQSNEEIEIAKSQIRLIHHDIRKILESIHPRELMEGKWRESLLQLADELSIGNTHIHVHFHTDDNPKDHQLHNVYRIIQEKISNILAHSNSNMIQIDVTSENNFLAISLVYKSELALLQKAYLKLGIENGRGLSIIKDRLKTIGASNSISTLNNNIIDTISLPL